MIKNSALVFIGFLVGLLLVEGAGRMMYTKPWHQHLLEEQTKQKISYRRNSLGLRDREYADTKPLNTKRVLILGDSFSHGDGVTDDAAVFPELLEKELNAEFAGQGIKIEILNGGIPGSLTDKWLNLLLKVKDKYDFDVILIVFFLRDGTRTSSMGGFFRPIRDELQTGNEQSLLYQYSYLYRMYRDARDRDYLSDKYSEALNVSYMGGPEQTREWEIAKANMLQIKAIGAEIGAKVGLVVFPVLVELNDDYPFKKIYNVIVDFGIQNNFPTHGLLPDFMGENGPELWVSPVNQHPNEQGHQIAGKSILPFLRQLIKDSLP
jgi:lysophospholipase L1-like esterase